MSFIRDAHLAARSVAGIALTLETVDGALTGNLVSEGMPLPDSGLKAGMDDYRNTYQLALLVEDLPEDFEIIGGLLVTFTSRLTGQTGVVVAGSLTRTDEDWRFEIEME
jgi:hypothetical protein